MEEAKPLQIHHRLLRKWKNKKRGFFHSLKKKIDTEWNGGVLRFGLDGGVPLEPPKPYPILSVIFEEKNTNF